MIRLKFDNPSLDRLLAVLDRDGEQARVVGGAVRDGLLGLPVTDIDVATTAVPGEVTRRAREAGWRTVPTGIEHGTVTVLVDAHAFEVTTLREDVETDGRHARVRFGRDFALDAERRDFTINALSMDRACLVHDSVGGLPDLEARRVRFIGDPDRRIAEDSLRILRFFRFFARFGTDEPDREGLSACIRGRSGLERLSRERIRAELMKLIVAPGAVRALEAMTEAGLLPSLLGGIALVDRLRRLAAWDERHGLVPDALLRLGALAVVVAEDAERLGEGLRLSNAETARLHTLAQASERIRHPPSEAGARRLLYGLGPQRYRDAILLAASSDPEQAGWQGLLDLPARWPVPARPFAAADLIRLGVEPGARLGRLLADAERWWIEADFLTDRVLLDDALRRLVGV